MLGLKLATDPRWVNIVESNIEEILTDHAWCEQKAASNAIYIIVNNSEKEELVTEMTRIALEEMEHFQMVHTIIKEKGLTLGRERKDNYVNDLVKFAKKDGSRNDALVERLLFAAMIEARSCERFKVLSENIQDPELAKFYRDLMISEAGHYTTFLGFAKKYQDNINVDTRWKEWIEYESSIIANYGNRETVHG
ncbi:tRNA 2-methylthio-N6-isopentenyl adenosine(37) hydroxylase MiaE [Flavobacterium ammoniigenes]|jgi:tRNA 2-(methylsulfanyl)-N6-isopentenyladenosine37 hydroxylase|uniref:tRNA 2-methylthio-N6-isopentenyl adenosine(37) hydroxylase MiaE n=1 Tax=Flavobacterium ammoniigenes TaxID=1751095 RepID=A0ABM7V4X2_9FLAO|nr:tRNA-(ms[2]io[6]A)-hydroxylase [Flavobacterium ammoniigenes]BDB54599.1 tRNA 2-methylthio-N6-isopentenyl adenosine(37) hydroxylase MiaE [Flavobacterium ammoniigenes]